MHFPLAALRIPSGWAVLFNILVELPDVEKLSPEDVDRCLSEDLLWLEQVRFTGGAWALDAQGLVIGVSWSAPGSIEGAYVLSVASRSDPEDVAERKTKDLRVITGSIEEVFEMMHEGARLPEFRAHFARIEDD